MGDQSHAGRKSRSMTRRKFAVGDRIVGNEKKASYRRRKGVIVRYAPESQYWVEFDDGQEECVNSSWIDKEIAKYTK
jgi:hypothetical protein